MKQNDDFIIRQSQRINKLSKVDIDEEDEQYFQSLKYKNIIDIDDKEILDSLNQFLSDNELIRLKSLFSLIKISKHFPNMLLTNFSSQHFEILYQMLKEDETSNLVLPIIAAFSKKNKIYIPPNDIFVTLSEILQRENADETEIDFSLVISGNLIDRDVEYCNAALQSNILSAIINVPNMSSRIVKLKIWCMSIFAKYPKIELENIILKFLICCLGANTMKPSISLNILNAFYNMIQWSKNVIEIIITGNVTQIAVQLLLSEKSQVVAASLLFLKSCIMTPEIENVIFIQNIVLLFTKDEEKFIYKDVIDIMFKFATFRPLQVSLLLESIVGIDFDRVIQQKSLETQMNFLNFLAKFTDILSKEIVKIPPQALANFLCMMIETEQSRMLSLSLHILCQIFSSLCSSNVWLKDFIDFIKSTSAIEAIDRSLLNTDDDEYLKEAIEQVINFLSQ